MEDLVVLLVQALLAPTVVRYSWLVQQTLSSTAVTSVFVYMVVPLDRTALPEEEDLAQRVEKVYQ